MLEAVRCDNLTKDFGSLRAVDHVSFSVSEGEVFGLLGPNGAGKTTTIRLLGTILKPTEGTAQIAGHDICKDPVAVRRNIGMLTVDTGLYDRFTARENVAYFGRLHGMTGAALYTRIDELFHHLDMTEYADRRAGKFSTGMKQKVAIARAIIHNPPVLFLDEPTSGLDVLASQTVLRLIDGERKAGKTIILSTHQMMLAQKLCERAAIIHRGKLIALDSTESILRRTNKTDLEDAFMELVGRCEEIT